MPVIEGNLPTGHQSTIRTGLPEAAWRKLNYGIPRSKSTTAQVVDTCGILEARSEIDVRVAALNGNTAAFRATEDKAFIESMSQQIAETIFYGDVDVHPERFLGLHGRYNDSSAINAEQILDAGGQGADNASIWLIGWGNDTIHGFYPKGSKVGLQHKDLGEIDLQDANGNKYRGLGAIYSWDLGLAVKDWRYAVRIANVDISDLSADPEDTSTANLINLMTEAVEQIHNLGNCTPRFYMPRKVRTKLRQQINNKHNVWLKEEEIAGKKVMAFDGIPVRRVDQLLLTEAQYQ